MPFIVSREQPNGKLFIKRAALGNETFDYWIASRDKATRFEEGEADAIAAGINQYSSTEALVEGAKAIETTPSQSPSPAMG